ncbi:homeobox and leucine zipper encoding b [Channa argus]|uniref:homeobox and leucine zipper encoding b n=1 Tax=Channa argus TaxID=215402 RepID=UPI003521FF31
MRHVAEQQVLRLSRAAPKTCRETNVALEAFSLNQKSAVCLPVVSDSQKLIWVHSNQIDLQLDGTEELEKAFDRFPYLTEKETTALAQYCCVHPDQVKVWFMLQRLRYGISWDYKDIHDTRRKVRQSQGNSEMQKRMREEIKEDIREKKQKRKVTDSGANEVKMTAENVKANKQLEGKMKQEKPVKRLKDRKVDKEKKDKKRRKHQRIRATNEVGKTLEHVDKGVVERAGEEEIKDDQEKGQQKSIWSKTLLSPRKKTVKTNKNFMSVQERPAVESFVVPDELLDRNPLVFPQPQTQAFNVPLGASQIDLLEKAKENPPITPNIQNKTPVSSSFKRKPETEARLEEEPHVDPNTNVVVTHVDKLKELIEMNNFVADSSPIICCNTKTQNQLGMMRMAFCHCQYPDSQDYDQLAAVIGISRCVLVQWFGDMRYYIKRGKPRWMTNEQHSQALANVKYRQCLKALQKV